MANSNTSEIIHKIGLVTPNASVDQSELGISVENELTQRIKSMYN